MSALAQTHKAAEAAAVAHARKPAKPTSPALLPRQRLRLGGAQDEAEHQAERIADRVSSAPAKLPEGAPASRGGAIGNAANAIRRALSRHADTQTAEAPDSALQREEGRRTDDDKLLPEPLEARLLALLQGGDPLPEPTRRQMEQRLGMSLASVRIHTDGEAASLNDAVGAHAFTLGEHIAFNRGRFQPDHPAGEHLLAHELAHVAQHRAQADAIERAPVRRGFWSDLYDSAASTLGDIADWAWDQVQEFGWDLLESIAPEFARTVRTILDEGILPWLGRQVARAWDGFIGGLRALVPFEGPQQLIDLFAGLVERAANIVVALASGNCEPLMSAIGELKTFVVETAGVAWNKLTEFLAPIGTFFTDLWNSFGAPAVQWLQDFGGAVWEGIQELGRQFWEWIRPVREAAERIWNWFSDLLFGSSEGESGSSEGGVLGWITRKAGEAWDWVKEQTRPVWQPVAEFAGQVAELIPPAFIREMGESAQQLSTQLNDASAGMEGGDGVADNRDTLASVLPSVETIISTIRRIIVGAGAWLVEKVGVVGTAIGGLISRLSNNSLLSWLGSAFSWLADLLATLTRWAQEKVSGLFDWLVQGFDALTPFLQLVLETVRKVISIYADILQLPILILNSIWQRVPACIREPIENFIQTQILARIPVFGQFFSDPELWPRVRDTALTILRRLFVDGDIAGAAWLFFQSILRILGLPPELVVQVLAKAAAAIGDILTNPIGFLINLVRTMGAGFMRFFGNIGTHLLNGLTGWLFGALREAGIQPPTDFSLGGILSFVMEVLGITVDNVFSRLSERIGPETTARLRRMLDVATGVWSFVSVLVTEGPAGLWRELTERLSTLWDQVVEGVTGFITERVIGWATRWLTSLLDVTGIMPAINTIIAIYNAIQSFIDYLREILEIVSRVLDGINSIARGEIEPGAEIMEGALGSSMPIAIGFLANQAGLGRLSQRLREILGGLQERVNGAIDWIIDRAIRLGQSLLDMARRGVAAVRNWWEARRGFHAADGEEHHVYLEGTGSSTHLMVASGTPTNYSEFIRDVDVPAADKTEAVRIARELDTAIRAAAAARVGAPARGRRGGAGAGAAAAADPAANIDRLLGELATATARFMPPSGDGQASTPPVYGPVNTAGYGTSATVLRLTHRRSFTGSGPDHSLRTPAYHRLNQRRYGGDDGSPFYVLGHLLNHNLGGPGTTWSNLTPLTQVANNRRSDSMLHGFEKHVKNTVEGRDTPREMVNFVVTANYNMPDRAGDVQAASQRANASSDNAEKSRWLAISEVAQEEAKIPSSVSMIANILRPDGTVDRQLETLNSVDNLPATDRNINQYGVNVRPGILEDHRSER